MAFIETLDRFSQLSRLKFIRLIFGISFAFLSLSHLYPHVSLAQGVARQERGFATGRVTLEDGSPLPASVQDVELWLSGVTSAGERVSYSPQVRPDGTFRQKLAPGEYRFSGGAYIGISGQITVRHQGRIFKMPLEPVGDQAFKSRDAATGFVQNFVWKPRGVTPAGLLNGPSPGSATHWYGMQIQTQPGGWWADYQPQGAFTLGRAANPIPAGTKITMKLRPLTPAIDGSAVSDITIVRDIDQMGPGGGQTYRQITTTFHDLPPADYELAGFATLPNGSRHTLLFRGTEADRLGYLREARVNLEPGGSSWGFGYRVLDFYLDGTPPGTALNRNGPPPSPIQGRADVGMANPSGGIVVGSRVEILWNGTWYSGVVKAIRGQNQWLIGYDGYDASWDEVVGPERVREKAR